MLNLRRISSSESISWFLIISKSPCSNDPSSPSSSPSSFSFSSSSEEEEEAYLELSSFSADLFFPIFPARVFLSRCLFKTLTRSTRVILPPENWRRQLEQTYFRLPNPPVSPRAQYQKQPQKAFSSGRTLASGPWQSSSRAVGVSDALNPWADIMLMKVGSPPY